MPESPPLHDGETRRITSASGSRYDVKNVGGVYSCSCPGWRNQSRHPSYRTCKHLVEFRGARDEAERIAAGGRDGMPATVSSLVLPYWPGSGAGRARDIETGRLPAPLNVARSRLPEPASVLARGELLAGGAAMRHPAKRTRTAPPAKPVEPPKKHNAWSALIDDDHPLAEPALPAPPPTKPANDVAKAKAAVAKPATDAEPEWTESDEPPPSSISFLGGGLSDLTSGVRDPAAPLDPAHIIAAGSTAAVTLKTAFRGVLLAQDWDGVQDVTGWIMSEKLDGVRAYWDGEYFFSRNGNVWSVPDWYKVGMPKAHLDGEFWIGRGRFQETSGYCRRMDRGEYWKTINFMVFDVPSLDVGFEARLAAVGKDVKLPDHVKLLPHAACPSIDVLKTYLGAVEEQGGEGVMLRQPGSRYVRTRSPTLLKVKTFFDTEAEVTGTTAGKGRHDGAVGALEVIVRETITLTAGKKTCTIKGGTEFEVGTGLKDIARRHGAIPVGSIITFRFQELSTKGIPRFPSLIGVRNYE